MHVTYRVLCVRAARITSPYSLRVVKSDQKEQNEGFRKPFLFIFSYEKTRCRGGWESNVFPNPKRLVVATPLVRGILAWYIDL